MKKANLENQKRWILQEKHGGKLTKAAQKDIARLEAWEPVDYIIGWVDFLGCKIDLSKKPLIPRVETEFWTEELIKNLKLKIKNYKILDMFAGSGAIGIAIMRHIKYAQLTFVDSEKSCIDQIKINCKINKISPQKYSVIHSDMFENVSGAFDVIVANPPYIPNNQEARDRMQTSTLKHESHTALFGGGDGLFFIRQFLAWAKDFLTPNGTIYMEFDSPQKPSINRLLKKLGYKSWKFHKDQFGTWRWVSIS